MKIQILSIGKFKQGPERSLFEHYQARLNGNLSLVEIMEPQGEDSVRIAKEAKLLQEKIWLGKPVIALDEKGETLSSRGFAGLLSSLETQQLSIIIGGASGLDQSILQKANHIISLGRMTWPHLLVRGLIAEQLYRAILIQQNHPYHRD